MNMNRRNPASQLATLLAICLVFCAGQARALVTVTENFTGSNTQNPWALIVSPNALTGSNLPPCLTAGTATSTVATSVPYCGSPGSYTGGWNGSLPDSPGTGALRLTHAINNEATGIISATEFSSDNGLQVTFTDYAYGGSGGTEGADGFSFFLLDASYYTVNTSSTSQTTVTYTNSAYGTTIGGGNNGGSFGYSCSNNKTPIQGIIGGYLALGLDEYGNFLNAGDNSAMGATSAGVLSTANNLVPNRISLRGAGSIAWSWLTTNYPTYYPSTLTGSPSSGNQYTAVYNTCTTGLLQNWSNGSNNGSTIPLTWSTLGYSSSTSLTWANLTASSTYGASGTIAKYYTTTNFPNSTCQSNAASAAYIASSCNSSSHALTAVTSPSVADYAPITTSSGTAAQYVLPTSGSSAQLLANTGTTKRSAATPVNYKLILTGGGLLSVSFSYNGGSYTPLLTQQSITSSNGSLPANFLFGFGGSTGGSTNIHEITCFSAVPSETAATSAGVNGQQSGQIQTTTKVYLAYFHTVNPGTNVDGWWGNLTSTSLVVNSTTGTASLATLADWDASCVLTGATSMWDKQCDATQAGQAVQAPSSRTILTSTGVGLGGGVAFEWPSDTTDSAGGSAPATYINSTQQTALGGVQTVLDYIRGDRSLEGTTYKQRFSVLGDVENSSPVWVTAPSFPYTGTWSDLANATDNTNMPENTTSYASFMSKYATRMNFVFAGANDGMLHAFRAGNYTTSGTYSSTYNDGQEVLAYVPAAVISTINNAATTQGDFPNLNYAHNYYVDSTVGFGDLLYGGAWHSWVAGGLGTGGNSGNGTLGANTAFYVLDVTSGTFSESTPTSTVIGEWNPSTLTSANCTTTAALACGKYLGNIMGAPQIRRLHDGDWGVIFGNGINSANSASGNSAGIFIMDINSSTGAPTFYYLDSGLATSGNGIAQAQVADLDADGIVDYVYGGDLLGNMWRFDLTSHSPSSWKVTDYTGGSGGHPLFTTTANEPITTTPVIAIELANSGQPRVMVDFGTGETTLQSLNTAATYSTTTQNIYGIWDWNMSAWNALNSLPLASLSLSAGTSGTSSLRSQTASVDSLGNITVTNNSVCWYSSSDCSTGDTQLGWYLIYPSTNVDEQVIYNPIFAYNEFVVNTTVPSGSSVTCNAAGITGYTIAISPSTGGGGLQSFFANFTTGNFSTDANGNVVNGVEINAVGSPAIVSVNGKSAFVSQTTSGSGVVLMVNSASSSNVGYRANWTQLR